MFDKKIVKELIDINALLRSKEFSITMAAGLNAVYHGEQEQFISGDEDHPVIYKTVKEEKIAMNLAGFYALECGVGFLCEQTRSTPVEWLKKIVNNKAGSDAVFLLNRFANATWKAAQPFRGLDRITRYNFTGAGYLSPEDIEKDSNQVTTAAIKTLEQMQHVEKSSLHVQMDRLKSLMQDVDFALEIAKDIDASYYRSQHQAVPLFLDEEDEKVLAHKSAGDEKIAINLAGFYALECCINYLVTTKRLLPTDILKSIGNDSIHENDKMLLLRFANATWKAGQPFRDLNRITREAFVPVYFLNDEDKNKDMVQVKAAARILLSELEKMV